MKIEIAIKNGNLSELEADVIILKFTNGWAGSSAHIANLIGMDKSTSIEYDAFLKLEPHQGKLIDTQDNPSIKASNVFYLSVGPLYQFRYKEIREFITASFELLKTKDFEHIGLTIHGVGYGLDEKESFLSLISGVFQTIKEGTIPPKLKKITIIDTNTARCNRLADLLKEVKQTKYMELLSDDKQEISKELFEIESRIENAGVESAELPHIFVAMPFIREMDDVYYYGIQKPVQEKGYLCERIDHTSFTGDILQFMKKRIETASLVIADLTGANANVYLEVGYAWGKGVPTLLLVKDIDELKFDVKTARCIVYDRIVDLENTLSRELESILK